MMEIQLTIAINFMYSKDNDEECVMHSKSDNRKIMINDKADEVSRKLFKSLLSRHEIGLEVSLKCGGFVFDYVDLLHYKCRKINPNCAGSYRDFLDWIKTKKLQ